MSEEAKARSFRPTENTRFNNFKKKPQKPKVKTDDDLSPAELTETELATIHSMAPEDQETADLGAYSAAVNLAQNDLQGLSNVTDKTFRDAVDYYFQQMQAGDDKITGDQFRGEDTNPFVQIDRAIDYFNNDIVGGTLDGIYDNSIAKLINAINPELQAEDWLNKEDFGMAADIAEDLLLSALGPAGMAAVVAKNGIQNQESFGKFISGQDETTGEELSDEQKLAAFFSGAVSTGLSAIPGIGKASNAIRFADDVASNSLKRSAGDVVKGFGDSVKTGAKMAKDDFGAIGAGGSVRRGIKNALGGITGGRGTARTVAQDRAIKQTIAPRSVFGGTAKPMPTGIHPEVAKAIEATNAAHAASKNPIRQAIAAGRGVKAVAPAAEAGTKAAAKAAGNGITGALSNVGKGLGRNVVKPLLSRSADTLGAVGASALGDMGNNGTDITKALENAVTPENWVKLMLMPGRSGAKRLPGPTGKMQMLTNPGINKPFSAQLMSTAMNQGSEAGNTAGNIGNMGMNPEQVIEALEALYAETR